MCCCLVKMPTMSPRCHILYLAAVCVTSPVLVEQTVMAVFDRLAAKLGPRSRKDEPDEDDAALLESVLEMAKHPRAQLPPEPDDLTELQVRDTREREEGSELQVRDAREEGGRGVRERRRGF